jgi:hypothetical protein
MLRPSGIDRTLQQAAVQSDLAEKAALVDELDAILAQRDSQARLAQMEIERRGR